MSIFVPWKRFSITLHVQNRVMGGVPMNPDLIKGWIAANMPAVAEEELAKLAQKTASELPAAAEEVSKGMHTTFKSDKTGIYIEGRQVKAMFKESANILRDIFIENEKAEKIAKGQKPKASEKSRFTNLKAKLAERMFVEQDKLYFSREVDGKVITLTKPDGSEERPIHVITAQGPRSALKKSDFVNGPASVTFTVRWLNDIVVDLELVIALLDHAGFNGLGADRSQGNGIFMVGRIAELDMKGAEMGEDAKKSIKKSKVAEPAAEPKEKATNELAKMAGGK